MAALAILLFIMWFALRLHSHMWRQVSSRYRGKPASTKIARKLETTVIAARGLRSLVRFRIRDHRKYAGLLIDIHVQGLALSLLPPFNIMCPPVFLPFDEMDLNVTDWALWSEPYAIRMRRLPEIDIILGPETVRWIRDHVDRAPFAFGA